MTDTPPEEPVMEWPAPIPGNAPEIAGSPWLDEPVTPDADTDAIGD